MGDREQFPEEIKRFILTSIDSVPHLEALLLLRQDPALEWDTKSMAQQLYLSEKKAHEILSSLAAAGFAAILKQGIYCYKATSPELRDMLDRLAAIYPKNLIAVTELIHAKTNKQAQQFGDAFKWKEPPQ